MIFFDWRQQKQIMPGIVYASQERGVGEIIRGLMVIHEVLEADEMAGRVEYL